MNLPDFLTAEQKAEIQQSLRDTELRKRGMYFKRFDQERYGSPEPVKEISDNKRLARIEHKVKEQDAVITYFENKVNAWNDKILGLLKISHTHSKKSKEDRY